MSKENFSVMKFFIENPEVVAEGLEFICSLLHDKTKPKIQINPETDTDDEDQLDSFGTAVQFLHESTMHDKIVWERCERENEYSTSVDLDDARHDYTIFIEDNSHVHLNMSVSVDGEHDFDFCIGQGNFPLHPKLNKMLSDLFFAVEDKIFRKKPQFKSVEHEIVQQEENTNETILSFIIKICELTDAKAIRWSSKADAKNQFRTLLKKSNGTITLLDMMQNRAGAVEVRAAQIVDGKPKKLFHVVCGDAIHPTLLNNIENLYSTVQNNCVSPASSVKHAPSKQ